MTNTPTKDPLHERIILGTAAAGVVSITTATQTATPMVVWSDGRVQELRPDDPSLRRTDAAPTDKNR